MMVEAFPRAFAGEFCLGPCVRSREMRFYPRSLLTAVVCGSLCLRKNQERRSVSETDLRRYGRAIANG